MRDIPLVNKTIKKCRKVITIKIRLLGREEFVMSGAKGRDSGVAKFHCYKVVHLIVHYIIGLFYKVSICVSSVKKEKENYISQFILSPF